MNKLEKRIIGRVYKIEAKKTFLQIISKAILVFLTMFLLWIFGSIMFQVLYEQRSFDFVSIFKEDGEVIKKYLFDSLFIFYVETPKTLLIAMLILLAVFIFILLTVIKNFAIIVNKLKSIYKFYKK